MAGLPATRLVIRVGRIAAGRRTRAVRAPHPLVRSCSGFETATNRPSFSICATAEAKKAQYRDEAITVVTLPLQVRIKSVDPKPHSHDPEFVKEWSSMTTPPPDFEGIAGRWQGGGDE